MSTRSYRSPLRDAQADATRGRIGDAAQTLFEEVGFGAATVTEIARRAEVSPATVYAVFESKAGIIGALIGRLESAAGMDWRIPEMMGEEDPHRSLRMFVAGNRAVFETGHAVLRAAFDAIGTPEVKRLVDAGDANRRRAVHTLVGRWHRQGALRPGVGTKRATDTVWLLSSPGQYLLATDVLGWSGNVYERRLYELLSEAVLTAEP